MTVGGRSAAGRTGARRSARAVQSLERSHKREKLVGRRIADHELLAGFVDQYFDAILKVWETKGFEIAETTATLLFPSWVISEETVKKAQHWLDVTGKDASHALRRSVTEGRDAMSRAIKARAADK